MNPPVLQPHVDLASALFPECCEPIALLVSGVADTNMGQKGKQVRCEADVERGNA